MKKVCLKIIVIFFTLNLISYSQINIDGKPYALNALASYHAENKNFTDAIKILDSALSVYSNHLFSC